MLLIFIRIKRRFLLFFFDLILNLAINKQRDEITKKEWTNKKRTRTKEQRENERTESERIKEWKNDWDERASLQTYAVLIRSNIIITLRLFNDWWNKIINIKSIKLINNSFNEKNKKKKRTKVSHYRLTSKNAKNDVLTFDTILQCWAIQRISFSVVLIKFSSLMNLSSTIEKNDDDVDSALIDFINRKINQNEWSRDSLLI
jgi:hypothetical protein